MVLNLQFSTKCSLILHSVQYGQRYAYLLRISTTKEVALLYPLLVDLVSCTDGGYRYTGISTDFAIQIKDVLLASPEMEIRSGLQKERKWDCRLGY